MVRNKNESINGIELSGCSCVICGWNKSTLKVNVLVEGAHVKPLEFDSSCDNRFNIISLCPNHHAMFDKYMFYIDPDELIVRFQDEKDEYNNIDISEKIRHVKKEYLAYRKYLYDKNN